MQSVHKNRACGVNPPWAFGGSLPEAARNFAQNAYIVLLHSAVFSSTKEGAH
jgi:hypothetical protein